MNVKPVTTRRTCFNFMNPEVGNLQVIGAIFLIRFTPVKKYLTPMEKGS